MNKKTEDKNFDVIGIGFGPANIALAIAAEELGSTLKIKFLEKNLSAGWQEEMLLPESDIQNHPLRDLVTPRNPRSKYTFVNFLFEQNRLFEHLNLPIQHPLRLEYRQYVTWVANHFSSKAQYQSEVKKINPIVVARKIVSYDITYNNDEKINSKSIVLAPGRTPHIPPEFQTVFDKRIIHFTKFLSTFKEIKNKVLNPRIAVIGGSQTAVELLLHLTNNLSSGYVVGINRNFGFRLKDTSPFSDEVYFPKFVDTFFYASREDKARLRNELIFSNYSASDRDVIDALYLEIYKNKIQGKNDFIIKNLTNITHIQAHEKAINLTLTHSIDKTNEDMEFDLVILATGFKDLGEKPKNEPYPILLSSMANYLEITHNAMTVDLDYRVKFNDETNINHAPLFLNGLCESTHGMGDAGSFSLLSLRSEKIINSLHSLLSCSNPTDSSPLSEIIEHLGPLANSNSNYDIPLQTIP
jgi:L-ornithine N5-oxygenase